jgi:hypothetical protein
MSKGRDEGRQDEIARSIGVRRRVRRINLVTLLLWVLAAGMAALMVAEYVSDRM